MLGTKLIKKANLLTSEICKQGNFLPNTEWNLQDLDWETPLWNGQNFLDNFLTCKTLEKKVWTKSSSIFRGNIHMTLCWHRISFLPHLFFFGHFFLIKKYFFCEKIAKQKIYESIDTIIVYSFCALCKWAVNFFFPSLRDDDEVVNSSSEGLSTVEQVLLWLEVLSSRLEVVLSE